MELQEIYNHEKKNDKFDFLFLCYGGMLEETLKAATKLFIEEELTSKILLPNQINPIEEQLIDEIFQIILKNWLLLRRIQQIIHGEL